MTTKRILFIALCVLLVLVIIMFAIVLNKVGTLLNSFTASNPSTNSAGQSSGSSHPSDTTEPSQSEITPPTFQECEHNYILTEQIAPTCDGYGWNIYTCTLCQHTDMPLAERTDPLGHDYAPGEVVAPTCTEAGYTKYVCIHCQSEVNGDANADPLGHEYGEAVELPANCGEDAHTAYPCTREGCTEVRKENIQEGTATGEHSFGDWVPNEELTEMTHTCQVCGFAETQPYEELPPSGDLITLTGHTQATMTDADGIPYILHIITLGTETEPVQYTITITDYSNSPDLAVTYDAETGPALSYTDPAGTPIATLLAKGMDLEILIDLDGNLIG